jgi:hypothetical protein
VLRLLLRYRARIDRDALLELNGRVVRHDTIGEAFDRAWRMLRMRRILIADGDALPSSVFVTEALR